MIILLLLLYVFTGMPWVLAFEEYSIGDPLFIWETLVDCLFAVDIIITLNTGLLLPNEEYINSHKEIFLHYLKGMLLIDILAVFPFYLISDFSGGHRSNAFIRFLRFSKLSRIFRASKILKVVKSVSSSERMERILKLIKTYEGITRLISIIFLVFVLIHFTACIWYFTAKLEGLSYETWVVRHGF